MKNTIYFSICRYVPSLLRGETMNIGFVYHIPTLKKLGFYESKNKKRLLAFDDELDMDMVNILFETVKYDFNETEEIYDGFESFIDLSNKNLLNEKIYNYVNQIQFGEISMLRFEDSVDNAIKDIADMFLYFDKPKNQRIDHDRVKALAKKIIKSSSLETDLSIPDKNDPFYNLPYDFKFMYNDKPLYVKGLSFDYSQPNRFYKEIKSYLFDLDHALNSLELNIDDLILVINNTELEKDYEKIIQNILPKDLEYCTLENFSNMILNSNNELFIN